MTYPSLPDSDPLSMDMLRERREPNVWKMDARFFRLASESLRSRSAISAVDAASPAS